MNIGRKPGYKTNIQFSSPAFFPFSPLKNVPNYSIINKDTLGMFYENPAFNGPGKGVKVCLDPTN